MSEFDKEFEKVSGVKFPLGSGYYSAFSCGCEAGQQSQQAKIDELQDRIDELEKHLAIVLDEYYIEGRFSTKICNEAEKALNKDDRLNDSWYVKHVKPYSE